MNNKAELKKWFCRDNLLILVLTGILLFIVVLPTKKKDEAVVINEEVINSDEKNAVIDADYESRMEMRLKEIVEKVAGAGKVDVMITLYASEEYIVEKDAPINRSNTNENDSAGGNRMISQMNAGENTVYRTEGTVSEPYVVKTVYPKVEGVVVVAEGAGNEAVSKSISEMVQILFGLEAYKVKVVKMNTDHSGQ